MSTATATALNPEQVYNDLKKMIYKLIHNFQKRHGGDWYELLSEANWYFMQAYHTYDPSKAKIITHVYWRIWYGLLSSLREKNLIRYAPHGSHQEDVPLDTIKQEQQDYLDRLRKELSPDALAIVRLALSVKGRKLKDKRRQVVEFLAEYGWAAREVIRSFKEIREVL